MTEPGEMSELEVAAAELDTYEYLAFKIQTIAKLRKLSQNFRRTALHQTRPYNLNLFHKNRISKKSACDMQHVL